MSKIDPEELRDLLAEIAIEGNEQYKANRSKNKNRPYRRGVGSGMSKAANEVAEYYNLHLAEAENRSLRSDTGQERETE